MKSNQVVGWAVVAGVLVGAAGVLADGRSGGFVPGHVFVSEPSPKLCKLGEFYGWDRIWEIDPETGEVTLFVELADDWCGAVTGLTFTPDGTRLRASQLINSRILEFDAEGNVEVVLDSTDGISGPWGSNNLAYDDEGNFYVVNAGNRTIMKFPADGSPETVFADSTDGIAGPGAIAFAADGDLYFANVQGGNFVLRITPDGEASLFDDYGNDDPWALTADDAGHVYVGLENAILYRYDAGDPDSREVLVSFPFGATFSMTMSPDQGSIYVGSPSFQQLFAVDVTDGTVSSLAEFPEGSIAGLGIAVVRSPPPAIPAVSKWGVVTMTLLILAAGTVLCSRRRPVTAA